MNQKRILIIALLLVGSIALFAACNFPGAAPTESVQEADPPPSEVDRLFLDLYILLGGSETFGRPISENIWEEPFSCQTMMNARFCYDSSKEGVDAYFLAPIVRESNLAPPPNADLPPQQGEKLINGYTILPEFIPLYEQLYGTVFTGLPLSEARINYEKNRIEQYFENVIFARDLDNETGQPYLLPAGYATCAQHCSTSMNVVLPIPLRNPKSSPFSALLGPVHGEDFGEPLTRPFINQNGQLMQIFEYIAVVSPPNNIEAAQFFALPDEMNMFRMDAIAPNLSGNTAIIFYPTEENGNGYHVPLLFDMFVSQHGGREVSGGPIAEVAYYDDETIRQCFETYCLDYVEHGTHQQVKMTPLGAWYLEQEMNAGRISSEVLLEDWVTQDDLTIAVGEQMEILPPETDQFIIVSIGQKTVDKTISGIGGKVYLTLEDQSVVVFDLPETNPNGVSFVTIPASYATHSGDLLRYELCLHLLSGEEICTIGAYVVHETNTP